MRSGNSNDRIAGVGGRCRNPKCALSPAVSVLLFDPRHRIAAPPHQQGTAALVASLAAAPLFDQPHLKPGTLRHVANFAGGLLSAPAVHSEFHHSYAHARARTSLAFGGRPARPRPRWSSRSA